jgi:hypothetical protein
VDDDEMTDRESGEGRNERQGHDGPEAHDEPTGHDRHEGDEAQETPSIADSIAAAEAFDSGSAPDPDFAAGPSDTEPVTALPEPPEPTNSSTPLEGRDSMTDEQTGRAEAEASAEAAFDDGRGTALPGDEDDRDPALDLATLHLRLGSLALARSELETFAGRGVLDANARIDLAEVRWRTGDLVGGGEVAREALAGGGEAVVALIVAAEAASALGRPSEARRLAGRALSLNGGPIDSIFAGMPRSSVWPGDPAEPVPSPSTLFPPERSDRAMESDREDATAVGDDRELDAVGGSDAAREAEPGLWDLHEAAALAAGAAISVPSDLDPSALFDAGRAALETGDRQSAAVHLGLVVRMAPALAPAALSLLGEPSDSGLQLVQGDAYRAVGHETEARRSYAAAVASASTPPPSASVESFEPPSTTEHRAQAWWLESLDESIAPAAWPPAAVQLPPEPAEPESRSEAAEPEAPARPEPETSPEPDMRDEPGTRAEAETPGEPEAETHAEAETPSEPAPHEAETLEAFAPPEPDRESESRDDEGGSRDDQEDWRSHS